MKQTKYVYILGILVFTLGSRIPVAFAAMHTLGTNISSPDGTVYTITVEGGQNVRRPYTSAGAFLSYGFNSWSNVIPASTDDMALTVGSFIAPQDGKIICSDRGNDKGTCYLISETQKIAFPSANIFTLQGFTFNHVLYGDVSFLQSGGIIQNPNQAHNPGVIVNKDGTLYFVGGDGGLWGFPDASTFTGWGYSFADAVAANSADRTLKVTYTLPARIPGMVSPYGQNSSTK
jgi:hypothetical protein